ncbi:MAG: hypothetical protein R3C53_05235 [Pirellulaceae bacterium]
MGCVRLMETLELEKFDDAIRQFSVGVPQRKELESTSQEYVETSAQVIAVTARLEAARESLAAIETSVDLDALPDDISRLSSEVARLLEFERDLAIKSQALLAAANDREFLKLEQCLRDAVPDIGRLSAHWSVPVESDVKRHVQAVEELLRESQQAKRQQAKLEKDLSIVHQQLAGLDRRGADELLKQATNNQIARDAIITQWLDDLSQPLIAVSIAPDDQRERLQELQRLGIASDQLHAELLAAADAVAVFNQKSQLIASHTEELQRVEQSMRELANREEKLEAAWKELWSEVPFDPATPESMLTWLGNYTRWRESASELERLKREAHIARGVVQSQRGQLQDLWPTYLRDETMTDVLVAQVRTWETATRDAQRDQQRTAAATNSVATLTQRLQDLTKRQAELQSRYDTWLAESPLNVAWPIEQVGKLIDSIEHLRREHAAAQRSELQLAEIRSQLELYSQRVTELAKELECRISSGLPETHAERWLSDLQMMRNQRSTRIELTASIKHRRRRVSDMELTQRELDGKLAALCSTAGSGETAAMGSLVDRVRRAEDLRIQISELAASIEPHSGRESLEQFLKRLATADDAKLELEIQEIQRELDRLDESRKQADQQVGSLTQRIEHLANNTVALRTQQLLQDMRGELAAMVDQWVVQRLAEELLARAIERFAADHEPALLQYTREFLLKLTHGRYASVEHDAGKQGGFIVRNARDESFTPDQLSTGTREQLYLAIRMAFITHHSEHHEPLPVIMDDCFVNFDDRRVGHTLEAIAGWNQAIQTILLTCHWRVVQCLAEFAPQTPVIYLDEDQQTTAGELFASKGQPVGV